MGNVSSEAEFIKKIIEILGPIIGEEIKICSREKPYGIVKERIPVKIFEKSGWVVWDYIIWNELTFEYVEEDKTVKMSLFQDISDRKTEERLRKIEEKYGI